MNMIRQPSEDKGVDVEERSFHLFCRLQNQGGMGRDKGGNQEMAVFFVVLSK